LKRLLEEDLGFSCHVDNDNNALALAAKWSGLVKEDEAAVVMALSEGLGTGILSKGSLFYGSHSNAGEIGHMTIQYDGPICVCGNRGCLETFTSYGAILGRMRDRGMIGPDVNSDEGIGSLVDLAKNGQAEALDLLRETGFFIGIALDHVIKVYDPDIIVLYCDWLFSFPDLFQEIVSGVFSRNPWVRRDRLRILSGPIEDIEGVGPATLVLESLFTNATESPLMVCLKELRIDLLNGGGKTI
jgi:predicted NBD/HSP70 family sugar kinase